MWGHLIASSPARLSQSLKVANRFGLVICYPNSWSIAQYPNNGRNYHAAGRSCCCPGQIMGRQWPASPSPLSPSRACPDVRADLAISICRCRRSDSPQLVDSAGTRSPLLHQRPAATRASGHAKAAPAQCDRQAKSALLATAWPKYTGTTCRPGRQLDRALKSRHVGSLHGRRPRGNF